MANSRADVDRIIKSIDADMKAIHAIGRRRVSKAEKKWLESALNHLWDARERLYSVGANRN